MSAHICRSTGEPTARYTVGEELKRVSTSLPPSDLSWTFAVKGSSRVAASPGAAAVTLGEQRVIRLRQAGSGRSTRARPKRARLRIAHRRSRGHGLGGLAAE